MDADPAMSKPAITLEVSALRRLPLPRGRSLFHAVLLLALAVAFVVAWRVHAPWPVLGWLLGIARALGAWVLRTGRGVRLVGPLLVYDLARLARRGRSTLLRCAYAFLLLLWLCVMVLGRFPDLPPALFLHQSPS